MNTVIKRIGFEDNIKCRICYNIAYYQIADSAFCERHMKGFIEFKKEIENESR